MTSVSSDLTPTHSLKSLPGGRDSRPRSLLGLAGSVCLPPTQKADTMGSSLEGVERLPGDHAYASLVIPMVLDATERYARLLRSRHIVLVKPHPKLMQKYEAAGYTHLITHKS